MPEPATIAILALATAGAGTVVSTISQRNAAKFQTKVAQQNAEAAKRDAAARAEQIERQRRRQRAATVAGFGAAGIDPNSGSALAVQIDQATQSALDVQTALVGGEIQARGFDIQASSARAAGSNAVLGGVLSGVSQLASGASSLRNAGVLSDAPTNLGRNVSFQ